MGKSGLKEKNGILAFNNDVVKEQVGLEHFKRFINHLTVLERGSLKSA